MQKPPVYDRGFVYYTMAANVQVLLKWINCL